MELHRIRSGNPDSGPIFRNPLNSYMNMNNLVNRVIRLVVAAIVVSVKERLIANRIMFSTAIPGGLGGMAFMPHAATSEAICIA